MDEEKAGKKERKKERKRARKEGRKEGRKPPCRDIECALLRSGWGRKEEGVSEWSSLDGKAVQPCPN